MTNNSLIPNLVIFYVKNPIKSSEFYEKIFSMKPSFSVPTWVAFSFDNGLNFALWSDKAKNFISGGTGHRSELSFMLDTEDQVKEFYDKWKNLGVTIEQDLHQAVFGLTFVALDSDGHRIRVCIADR